MSEPAAIALFVYNRPWHTKQAIEALQKNKLAKESDLIIFSDGPKGEGRESVVANQISAVGGQKTDHRQPITDYRIQEVREYIRTITGFKSLRIVERERNLGLANSIISGVTEVVNKYGKIIVLEDDLVTSPYFLQYMNDALNLYENEEKVISIHGYVYPIEGLPETFFLKGADCWGWATWKRGWDLFEADGKKLLTQLKEKKLLKRFDFDEAYPYTKMLKDQIEGKNDSWAIRWYASALIHDKLTLYPGKSLVKNIGTDSSGTHGDNLKNFTPLMTNKLPQLLHAFLEEDICSYKKFVFFLKTTRRFIFRKKILSLIKAKLISVIPNSVKSIRRRYFCKYGFKGRFNSWEEAKSASTGYAKTNILEKVKFTTALLKNGQIPEERDGVVLSSKTEWPPLEIILNAFNRKKTFIAVDYGGALGTLYFKYKNNFVCSQSLKWIVVEQENFVDVGKQEFADSKLSFITEKNLTKILKPDLLILSGVIQYLEKPYEKTENLINLLRPAMVVVDRTPFSRVKKEILTVQRVDPKIYDASYPAWLLDINKFLEIFKRYNYEIFIEFKPVDFDYRAEYKGFVFSLREKN